ncbi:hypothetical protein FB471_4156 [Amycolatopsis cihanbeyliensis]|uniref:Uncharacterized protein n=1 Tax=Amycolatopsis cihanbeyliensis TaxID=1128664 RepID=A0A542DMP8_AMYCI|nr:hypothetical protein FB471_4156 [Amycolatopsis cihanbeyliensis]
MERFLVLVRTFSKHWSEYGKKLSQWDGLLLLMVHAWTLFLVACRGIWLEASKFIFSVLVSLLTFTIKWIRLVLQIQKKLRIFKSSGITEMRMRLAWWIAMNNMRQGGKNGYLLVSENDHPKICFVLPWRRVR